MLTNLFVFVLARVCLQNSSGGMSNGDSWLHWWVVRGLMGRAVALMTLDFSHYCFPRSWTEGWRQ
jgi:hypothetical protein